MINRSMSLNTRNCKIKSVYGEEYPPKVGTGASYPII